MLAKKELYQTAGFFVNEKNFSRVSRTTFFNKLHLKEGDALHYVQILVSQQWLIIWPILIRHIFV